MSTIADDILKIGESESFVENSLELRFWRGEFSLEIDNPWAGSTETGFGYTTSMTLDREQAQQLADFLTDKLALLRARALLDEIKSWPDQP